MKIITAEHYGFCYGVRRAVEMAEKCKNTNGPVATLGPIIHNPQVVERLQKQGVGVASSLAEFSTGTVVIRSHGVGPSVYQEAESKGLSVVDATCPHVQKSAAGGGAVFSGGTPSHYCWRTEASGSAKHSGMGAAPGESSGK